MRLGEKRLCFCLCRRVAVKERVSGERGEKVVALVAGVPALRIISPVWVQEEEMDEGWGGVDWFGTPDI